MKKSALFLLAPLTALILVACDTPDIKNLNKMPDQTGEMSNKMDKTNGQIEQTNKNMLDTNSKIDKTNENMVTTNSAIHKQTLLVALTEMNKPENQALVFPIPTGLMAAGKAFAEEATDQELIELTYIWLRELEEVDPVTGLDGDMVPTPYTDADKAKVRLQKMSRLYGLMVIAGFTPDNNDQKACEAEKAKNHTDDKCVQDRLTTIIDRQIRNNGRYYDTAFKFLALRAYFAREVLLKLSLKVDKDSAENLKTSGMMNEALKYLDKLEFISKLPFASQVQVQIQEKQCNLISFEEKQDLDGQKATAQMWQVALDKAQAGMKAYQKIPVSSDNQLNEQLYQTEVKEQQNAISIMQSHVNAYKGTLL